MLRPIPARILKHSVTLNVCTGIDRYQNPAYQSTVLTKCVMQPSNATVKTKENTEVVLRGLLFVDAKRSLPVGLDLDAAKNTSELNGHNMTVEFGSDTYTVQTVDSIYDDTGALHHTEVGLI